MTRYTRGAHFERRVMGICQEAGWWASRAAGSHGEADVVALKKGLTPLLIQCKTANWGSPTDRAELAEAARRAGATPLMVTREGRRVVARRADVAYKRGASELLTHHLE